VHQTGGGKREKKEPCSSDCSSSDKSYHYLLWRPLSISIQFPPPSLEFYHEEEQEQKEKKERKSWQQRILYPNEMNAHGYCAVVVVAATGVDVVWG